MAKQFTRGATVHISLTFRDHLGAPIQPSGANVTLSFVPLNSDPPIRNFLSYALAANSEPGAIDWIYDWDSAVAEPGSIFGHAVTADVPVSAVDFEFRLVANRANKELAGDDCGPVLGY
jgi:hypothetical protein